MSNIDVESIVPLANSTRQVGRFNCSKFEQIKVNPTVKKIPVWKTCNFWVETVIFIISVIGAALVAYGIMEGFLLWFVSNSISIVYFLFKKQYPLSLQQFVFLIITILGIIHHSKYF